MKSHLWPSISILKRPSCGRRFDRALRLDSKFESSHNTIWSHFGSFHSVIKIPSIWYCTNTFSSIGSIWILWSPWIIVYDEEGYQRFALTGRSSAICLLFSLTSEPASDKTSALKRPSLSSLQTHPLRVFYNDAKLCALNLCRQTIVSWSPTFSY